MFKQITSLGGNEWYLITSLWIFLVFFIVVGIMLYTMRKEHVDYMGNIPLNDENQEEEKAKEDNE